MGSQNLTKTFRGRRIFAQLREHQQQLTHGTRITKAKFRFTLTGSPEVTATIHSGNIISYSRQVGVELIPSVKDIVTWSIIGFFVFYFIGQFFKARVKRFIGDLATNLANTDVDEEPEPPAPKPRARPAATRTRKRTAAK